MSQAPAAEKEADLGEYFHFKKQGSVHVLNLHLELWQL